MTKREAALKSCKDRLEHLENAPSHHCGKRQRQRAIELEKVKIEALRPITREQVEKMRGEIVETVEKARMKRVFSCCGCDFTSLTCWSTPKFCPSCGAPMTDEAVDMVMERLEKLKNEIG